MNTRRNIPSPRKKAESHMPRVSPEAAGRYFYETPAHGGKVRIAPLGHAPQLAIYLMIAPPAPPFWLFAQAERGTGPAFASPNISQRRVMGSFYQLV